MNLHSLYPLLVPQNTFHRVATLLLYLLIMVLVTAEGFWKLAEDAVRARLHRRSFIAHFGSRAELIAEIWARIQPHLPDGAIPVHLLWMFSFLKIYKVEDTAATRFNTTPKTWRKWVWLMLVAVQQLKPVVVRPSSSLSALLLERCSLFGLSCYLFTADSI